ncbi:MAG: right-handed parallel beta-helix repeat-containing protein [Promethearchaeota archaeon]
MDDNRSAIQKILSIYMQKKEIYIMDMDTRKSKGYHTLLVVAFLSSMVFLTVVTFNSEQFQQNSNSLESYSNIQANLTPNAGFSTSIIATPIVPQIIANESKLMELATSGDGLSWDTAYIIENITIEQNYTTYGLVFTNLSKYIIVRNSHFLNFYPDDSEITSSIYINNSRHIRIESCGMRAISTSETNGILIEHSSDIIINNFNIRQFSHGVNIYESNNCNISDSYFYGQYRSQIRLENSDFITIFNNYMRNPYTDSNYDVVDAIYGENISNCLIQENNINPTEQDISLYYAENLTFTTNLLPHSSLYFGANITVTDNEIEGTLRFSKVINIAIEQNVIQGGNYGIQAYNVYNFQIEANTFRKINYEIFHFDYFSESYPGELDDWYEYPEDSQEQVVKNWIYLASGELFHTLPSNIKLSGNIIVPQIGFFILMATSLGCISLYLHSFILYLKKIKLIQSLSRKLSTEEEDQQGTDSSRKTELTGKTEISRVMGKTSGIGHFTILLQMEQARFREVSYRLLFWLGMFCSFALSENFYAGRLLQTLLYSFVGSSYGSDLGLLIFLVTLELGILGIVLGITTYHNLKLVNRMPKVLQNLQNQIQISEFDNRIIAGILGLFAIFEWIIMSVMYRGKFQILALIIGIITLFGFLASLRIKFKLTNSVKHPEYEILLLGAIFIIGYILIISSIDPNITSAHNPTGVLETVNLLFFGFLLIGGIGWLRAYFLTDRIIFDSEPQ